MESEDVINLAKANGFGLLIFRKEVIDEVVEAEEQVERDKRVNVFWGPVLSSRDRRSGVAFIQEVKKNLFLKRLFSNIETLAYTR